MCHTGSRSDIGKQAAVETMKWSRDNGIDGFRFQLMSLIDEFNG
jgi:pullulanase/glycogen debranching enzyme